MKDIFLSLALLFFAVSVLVSAVNGFYLYALNGFSVFVALSIIATILGYVFFLANLKICKTRR